MSGSTATRRSLTLRAPIATEEERALFQRRLAITGLVVFALGGGFFVITLVLVSLLAAHRVPHLLTDRSGQVHLATTLASGAIWLGVRRGKPSVSVLSALDLVLGIGLCLGWIAMSLSGLPLVQRPELIALLACTVTLAVRAALIPSAPGRTALIGVLGLAPLVVATPALYASTEMLSRLTTADEQWLSPAIGAAIWGTLGIATTTVISYVNYGLRQEIRNAKQLGQYLLEQKIGEGGMGVVYRASHAMLRRPTAIKLLSGTAGHAAERFEREVQITARLTHPNTVAIFDYGRTPEGVFYYAMEYLDGISLEDLVADHGPQPPRRVAHILVQICGALEEAHAHGLVHRDVKPANIMLTQRGGVDDVVKVLDFGLVKDNAASELGKQDPSMSKVDVIMGTPHYMAPEAILDPANIDGRADLYAVGATAYFLLTGERVFGGTTLIEVCSQHLHEAPSTPSAKRPDVPKALDQVVLACLAKKADERPKDAASLAAMIRDCALGEWTRAEAVAWWTPVRGASSKRAASAKGEATDSAFGKTIAVALVDRAPS